MLWKHCCSQPHDYGLNQIRLVCFRYNLAIPLRNAQMPPSPLPARHLPKLHSMLEMEKWWYNKLLLIQEWSFFWIEFNFRYKTWKIFAFVLTAFFKPELLQSAVYPKVILLLLKLVIFLISSTLYLCLIHRPLLIKPAEVTVEPFSKSSWLLLATRPFLQKRMDAL